MTVAELIDALRARTIELWFEGDRLRYRAPKGALTHELRNALVARRSEVLGHLRSIAAATRIASPLSFTQRSLWFLHQQEPDSAAYHVALSVRIHDAVDLAALRQALQALVDRHPILRTTYDVVDGALSQVVAGTGEIVLECCDATDLTDEALRQHAEADHRRPFDLAALPPVRASLFTRNPESYVLLLTIHHISVDGWSLLMILDELTKLYHEAITGESAGLTRPRVTYADYVNWQEQTLAGPEGERLWSYWREQLGKPPRPLDLPTDRRRPSSNDRGGAAVPVAMDGDLARRLADLARQQNTTQFVALLATFHIFLAQVSGQDDVIVGAPAIARSKAEFLQVVGDFVNSLPLRARIRPAASFTEIIAQLRETVLQALDAQEFPLSLMVQRLQPEREPGRSPLFDVFFQFQRFEELNDKQALLVAGTNDSPIELNGLRLAVFPMVQLAGQFDLSLELAERPTGIFGWLKYRTDLFTEATAQRFAADYIALVGLLLAQPAAPIGSLTLPAGPDGSDDLRLFVEGLRQRDIRVLLDGERLRINAPKGALDENTRAAIADRRDELIGFLRSAGNVPGSKSFDDIPRIPRQHPLPVSAAQQRLWFLDRMQPGRTDYNIGVALRLRGALDLALLRRSINALVERHEALRMRIGERGGSPWLEIDAPSDIAIETVDVAGTPAASRDATLRNHAEQWLQHPFDLARGPLARFLIVRFDADDHALIISVHHVIIDGWSLMIAIGEICKFYDSLCADRPAALPPLRIQYVDYAAWERSQLRSGRLARQLDYWEKQLRGAPGLLELPTDRPRPASQSFRGARLIRVFDDAVIEALKACGREHETTLFMTLLAAWFVLLNRYSGQDDIVVGSPVANRELPALEGVIGCLINTLSLRAQLAGNPTFAELLAQVKRTALAAFENANVAFDALVERLNPERNASHAPIVQVLLTLMAFPLTIDLPAGLDVEPIALQTNTARYDITVELYTFETGPHKGRFGATYEFATDLFDASTIERMHHHFEQIILAAAADPAIRINAVSLITEPEQRLFDAWNATTVPHDRLRTVHHLLEATAKATPDRPAVIGLGVSLTYRELDRKANQLAHLLQGLGVRPGQLVAVCLDRTVDIPVALAAILKVGAGYLPIDPTHPSDRLRYVLEDAHASCVVTISRFVPLLAGSGAPLIPLDRIADELATYPDRSPVASVRPEDVAYVIYTSGSTGRPKGVQVEHRNVVSFLEAMRREPGLTADDVLLAVTTLSFDIAGLEIWLPLMVGARIIIASRDDTLDGTALIRLIDEQQVTLLQATPATWRLLLDAGWTGSAALKALCGGEALPADLASALVGRVSELWNMYGPTETTIWSTVTRMVDHAAPISIGHPIANTRVHIVDPVGNRVPIGVPGELCIAGEGVARGYRDRPELTGERFTTITLPGGAAERIYRTGDLARYRGNGEIEFLGRRDSQVKIRGYRIELSEIEAVLAKQHGVKESVVVTHDDGPRDTRLVGYLTALADASIDGELLRNAMRAMLPEYMVPNLLVVLPELPLTGNGKIDRKLLAARDLPRPAEAARAAAIMNAEEQRVAARWRDVLHLNTVGLNDNFFDLGGHSLLLAKLHVDLKQEFAVDFPLVELFQYPTVAAQAARLRTARTSSSALNRARARADRQLA